MRVIQHLFTQMERGQLRLHVPMSISHRNNAHQPVDAHTTSILIMETHCMGQELKWNQPLSERTHIGTPYWSTALLNFVSTVVAVLFSDASRNTTMREKPSMPP